MRSLTILAVAVLVGAARPAVGQGGVVQLDSSTVFLLAPLQRRIARADRLRVKSEAGSSVLVLPRLVGSGLGYASETGPAPDLAAQAFHLEDPGRATWIGAVIGGYENYNDNASRSLLFGFAEPFAHTGVRLTYPFSDRVSAVFMVANGFKPV